MKIITAFALIATTSNVASAEINFSPQSNPAQQRSLRGLGTNLSGTWGIFTQDGFCIEKMFDPQDPTSDKVKLMECSTSNDNPAQMWKFDKMHPNDRFLYGGLLYNMDGGCLVVRGDLTAGSNLKVVECDRSNEKQHWVGDGDNLSPRENKKLCVYPYVHPIVARDPVGMLDCSLTDSLDYFE